MTRLGSAAVAHAIRETKDRSEDWTALCLRFTRTCLGVPAREASAIEAYRAVPAKERHDGTPPPGVPVFWSGGEFGHVALSTGGGFCISTDVVRRGHADKCRISLIRQRWGLDLLGWTERLNGERVWVRPTMPPTVPIVRLAHVVAAFKADPKSAQGRGMYPADVRPVEAALIQSGLLDDRWGRDGAAGSKTVRAYARLQRRYGYLGAAADGIPGERTLRKLGSETGLFTVTKES